jgi:ATP-dependent Clp protease protease subunit
MLQPKGLPDPVLYQYYKNLLSRKIVINEQIGDELLETATLPFIEMDNDGTGRPIEIIISTVGGEVYSGFNLVDQIEKAKSPVTIHIMSMAASMGLLISMAGKNNPNVNTVCHSFSVGLLHSGSTYMEGTSHAVKDTFDFSQHYEEKIKDYILSHTNIDEVLYEKVERKEYWMDASEMVRLGIVDEII